MSGKIHPTAIVADGAELGRDVEIGAYCVIGGRVKIGDGTIIGSHVVIDGLTTIGRDNKIFSFAALGLEPQHMLYEGEESTLVIGDRNVIREYVTMHSGTHVGIMTTTVGDDCMFLKSTHVAHDAVVGNHVIMVNDSMAGGHVVLGDYAYVGGNSAIKQWVRVGKYAMINGMACVTADVIPFGNVFGVRAALTGLNLRGLKRHGFDKDQIAGVRRAYAMLFGTEGSSFAERLSEVRQLYGGISTVAELLDFIDTGNGQALCHPVKG